ncbi:MAG: folylpolyglutamate synthase/dihydrofolate synthase family protein [Candidatus Zixiibacteriota bacterium]
MKLNRGNYASALDFIMRREFFGVKLGLDNISRFLDRIGNPQNQFKSIHVAGTNGKGSTCAALDSILRSAGYKTGIFTSPHLADYRERVRVNGQQIGKPFVTEFVNNYRGLITRHKITFFETCTALAFSYFAYKKVDIAIIEVGLGGRLDATNTLNPILSIITDISFDHTNLLGNTLTKIAYEKAGIIKKQTPILTGILKSEPLREIKRISYNRRAPFFSLKRSEFDNNGSPVDFNYYRDGLKLNNLKISLPGFHQIKNGALSVRACELIKEQGFKIGNGDIRKGLAKIFWPGRFQIIKNPGKPTFILDVCHNPAGVKAFVQCFKELFPKRKADIIVGFVKNKDLKQSIKYLNSIARNVEVLRLNTYRTAEPEEIAVYFDTKKLVAFSESAVTSAKKLVESSKDDDIIIICGSHYAVGEFIPAMNKIV